MIEVPAGLHGLGLGVFDGRRHDSAHGSVLGQFSWMLLYVQPAPVALSQNACQASHWSAASCVELPVHLLPGAGAGVGTGVGTGVQSASVIGLPQAPAHVVQPASHFLHEYVLLMLFHTMCSPGRHH